MFISKAVRAILLYVIILVPNLEAKSLNISEFIKHPSARDVKISPNGKHLAIIFRSEGEDVIGVLDTKSKEVLNIFGVGNSNKSIGQFYWVNNKRLVYSIEESHAWNKQKQETGELVAVSIDGSQYKVIFGHTTNEKQTGHKLKKGKADYGDQKIIDLLRNDDKNILIAFYPWREKSSQWISNPNATPIVYKLNIYTGKKRRVDSLPLPYAHAVTDNFGKVRFAIGVNKENKTIAFSRAPGSDKWLELSLEGIDEGSLIPINFTEDNKHVYFSASVANGTRALYTYNLLEGSISKVFHDEQVDVSKYVYDFTGRKIVAVGTELGAPKYEYLHKENSAVKIHEQLMKDFDSSDVQITSVTSDEESVVVKVTSDVNSGRYYLIRTDTPKPEFLVKERSNLKQKFMASVNPIEFSSRDGLTIHGYITLPNDEYSKNYPLVVLPHSGPHGVRDYWGFDWEVQLLASKGYAVLQSNYRGSAGYGEEFQLAGYGQWGASMQDDLTDATLFAINNFPIDKERICIYGSSYGGYAALMGVVREPSLYKCAIGSMGVYDLPMMFEKGNIAERESGMAYLKNVLGTDDKLLQERSPVHNVSAISANILLIHGKRDAMAPLEQANSLRNAFDKIGKEYDWLLLDDEGHGYYDESNRLTVYNKILDFLDRSLSKE
ncbi:MAG: prolyl oligopeptidase family serine peptidase [Kangiellaceae bacterium]|nr:prolyl oligopeptidase family serine peptidase [Kangiellaceae bacterium]